jgi:hypothetical protein
MRCFKLGVSALALALVAASFLCSGIKAEEPAGDNIAFRWAFGAMVGPEQGRKFVPIIADTALQTGDKLKFMLELHKTCFVYLIYQSSQGDMSLLFPYQLSQSGSDNELQKMYYIPRDDSWFELDDRSGTETLYLIASVSRLNDLEELFQKAATGAAVNRSQAELIRARIIALKKQHRTLTASAERPVPIGGNVRGISKDAQTKAPDMGAGAIEVSAKDFYCRTFTIEHK